LLSPVDRQSVPVNRQALVLGGGFSAVECALRLSRAGLKVTLLHSESLPEAGAPATEGPGGSEINSMTDAAQRDANISVPTCARITAIKGTTGDFAVTMARDGHQTSARYGAIILATGHRTWIAPVFRSNPPTDEQQSVGGGIVSQEQLARMFSNPMLTIRPHTIGFVIDTAHAGSRFSTLATLNSALAARSTWDSEVYVFCRDVKVDSDGAERLYRRARQCGVVFVKCDTAPGITMKNGRVAVRATDVLLGEEVIIACDILVADWILVPTEESVTLSTLLGIRTDPEGFCQDDNIHLYPVASEKKGVFVAGGCRGDLDFKRALNDVSSAAISIYNLLSQGQVAVDRERVKADPRKCVACLTCIRVCPHGAIQLAQVDGGREVAVISDLACDACGVCASICPAKAIEFQDYRDDQLLAQIEALGET
jgi:heterodisulfide reductase subunit A-like polyferredoxin